MFRPEIPVAALPQLGLFPSWDFLPARMQRVVLYLRVSIGAMLSPSMPFWVAGTQAFIVEQRILSFDLI